MNIVGQNHGRLPLLESLLQLNLLSEGQLERKTPLALIEMNFKRLFPRSEKKQGKEKVNESGLGSKGVP